MFINLHNHSHYSILKWLPKPKDYVKKAKEMWASSVCLTDSWNIHWALEFYNECKYNDIKAILWIEIQVVSHGLENNNVDNIAHKIVLLAKNHDWFKNIIKLVTFSNLKWFDRIPRVDIETLKKYSSDLICLSWPISWEIPYMILSWKTDEQIVERINFYREIYWKDDYYLELMYHDDIPKQRLVTDKLIEIHKKYDIQVVATNNCYYIEKEDKKTQDVIMALWTGHEVDNPDRPTLLNWDYSFLSEQEMQAMFWNLPSSIKNTQKIADKINIKIETGWILIPKFELPEIHQKIYEEAMEKERNEYYKWKWERKDFIKKLSSDEWYLRYLSFEWLNWRYNYKIDREIIFELVKKLDKDCLEKKLIETSPEELKDLSLTFYSKKKKEILSTLDKEIKDKIERLEYELVVVHEMWFDAYFLIVADYINWARSQDIPVGPGRWSAAGSLMAYLSGITDIDPLPYKLLFERFLNPARVSMPDIDTDFSDDKRDKVIEYCRNKYWSDHVAQICTFGTFAARAAVKDIWRVRWVSFAEMNELAKLIPEKPGTKLKSALEDSIEFKKAYDENKKYKQIIDDALKIEWNVRQLWVHACAVIIAPEKMTNFTALQHPPKDKEAIVTQYSAYPLEDLGLLKMDFLWLRNLTIIQRTQKIVKANKNIDIDILKVDLDDQKVFEIFANGDTTWVFQFESDGMRKYLRDLAPNSFEDLIAMVSLYRPGPIAYIPTYIDVKYKRKELKYLTDDLREILEKKWYSKEEILEEKRKLEEDLWPILDVTYGIAVYQEQLMFLVQYMAWFSLWEADLLRRWVWKKKIDVIKKLKKEFIEKWKIYRWYKAETTSYIYEEMITPAANYSFNKSHAACYAFIAYQTAYLKAYYPTEFLTSMMTSDEENMERVVLEVSEAISKWINILPPDINESLKHFTYIDDKTIRFWLKAIKWLWNWPIEQIINKRDEIKEKKFTDLEDFVEKCSREVINKKSLEALILSGAMDKMWERWEIYANIEEIIRFLKSSEKSSQSSQMWLFDLWWDFEDKIKLKESKSFNFEEKLRWEKEMIGFSVSWHALDWLKRYCSRRSKNTKLLKMSFEEIAKLPEYKIEDKKDKKNLEENKNQEKSAKKNQNKQEMLQVVWVVNNIRKIVTKTGKNMMFLICEGFDYEFEVTIFDRDFDKYSSKVWLDKIVIVSWALNINLEYSRKSIIARDIKVASISQVRENAKELELFGKEKRISPEILNKQKIEEEKEDFYDEETNDEKNYLKESCWIYEENFDKALDNKMKSKGNIKNNIDKFIIDIPKIAKKEDLIELKNFLEKEKRWIIKIYIKLKWKEVYTKSNISDIDNLKLWIKNKWD